jgi:hypothetical protein
MRASTKWLWGAVGVLCLAGVLISPHAAPAQNAPLAPPYIWDGGGSDDRWDTSANWNKPGYPGGSDSCYFIGNSGTPWDVEPIDGSSGANASEMTLYESVTLTGGSRSLTVGKLVIDADSANRDLELTIDGLNTEFVAVP